MPLYDYLCERCGAEFEVQRKMADTSKVKCEACKSVRTTKIFSVTGIHFKGSGFYVTDSKGNGSSPASKARTNGEAHAEAKPKDKADKKAETKPDRKTSNSPDKAKKPASKGK